MAQRAPLEAVRPNRIPPHNLDAEQSVLGAMLESKQAIANVVEILKAADFYKPAHSEIFETIVSLDGRGAAADAITVAEELARRGSLDQIGGKPYIHGLLEAYPTASSAAHYARIVEENALLRTLIQAGNQIQEIGFAHPEDVEEAVDEAESIVYAIGDKRLRDDYHPIRDLLVKSMEDIETLYERGENLTGLGSGFVDLDEMTSGFQDSNLIIVAARPSMGKSSLLNDFALNAATRQQTPVVIFSLEMSKDEIVSRFLASEAKVDSQRLRKGSLQEQDWQRLSGALGRLAEAPIFIDDSANITLMEMRAKCRRLKARHGLGLVIIDYLQLMQSPRRSENRQQEVSEISRNLKILARELAVPVVCASQLNRGVEYRADKRPFLGDLRESGCVTGNTLVALANGDRVCIDSLVGSQPEVVTLDGWHLGVRRASKVWKTGTRPVFKLTTTSGRTIRATDNHPFLQLDGWIALGDLKVGDRIGVPNRVSSPAPMDEEDERRVVLLAHMIGDGSFVRRQPIRYASMSEPNLAVVAEAARAFGITARRRDEPAARCNYVFLPAPYRLTHGKRNPLAAWLDELGLFGRRSHEKFVPDFVFRLSDDGVALFLKHLWATDGCVWVRPEASKGPRASIYYATNSPRLAYDVQWLLLRLGIASRVSQVSKAGYRNGFHVSVSGRSDQLLFCHSVGGFGEREAQVARVVSAIRSLKSNTNQNTIPKEIWARVRSRMAGLGITQRQMANLCDVKHNATARFRFSPSRELLAKYAEILDDIELKAIANSDIFWDTVKSIEPDGVEDVYDMTVPETHNFVGDAFYLHNSIEQDSDIVMFIYRDEVYNPDSEAKGEAELIVAKHRNGPTGVVRLAFMNQYTKFASIAKA